LSFFIILISGLQAVDRRPAIPLLALFAIETPHRLCRIALQYCVWRVTSVNQAICYYDRIVAYIRSVQHNGAGANPYIVADTRSSGGAALIMKVDSLHVVTVTTGHYYDVRPANEVVTDFKPLFSARYKTSCAEAAADTDC
jgi:hypothetical protein